MFEFSSIDSRQFTFHRSLVVGAAFVATCILFSYAQIGFAARAESYSHTIDIMEKDPANGVVATKQYLSSHPDLPVLERATIIKHLAATYDEKLHDTKDALAALNDGLAGFAKAAPNSTNDATPGDAAQAILLLDKAKLLFKSSPEQTVALLDNNIPLLIRANDTSATYLYGTVMLYIKTVPPAKRPEKLVPIIQKALLLRPQEAQATWLMTLFVNYLLDQNKVDDALGYAKLAWMASPFDQKSISDSTTLLTTAWLAKEMNAGKGNAFMAAQKDASAPNPLTDVKLPTLDQQTWDATLKVLPLTDTTDRVTILLMEGKMREAMLTARQDLLAHPTTENSAAVLEMARVFKANDLNVVRANAFLQYFQTGKGTNPLDEFFKQSAAQPAAAAK